MATEPEAGTTAPATSNSSGLNAAVASLKERFETQQQPAAILPAAAGLVAGSTTLPSETLPTSTAPSGSFVSANAPAAEKEGYSGGISLGESEAAEKALVLSLEVVQEETITGSARIDGYGEFQVQGKIYPRGVEMTLKNDQYSIRLTGTRRKSDFMRGQFSFPAVSQRGAWQVKFMR